jgi:3-deoxy-manno-octulosonate cytidylyltransferase (CMP-KDO synthetase)
MSLVLGVIPARYASTRFPGKALASLKNRTLIEQVWLRANRADSIDRLVVATDDLRIRDAALRFGAETWMTSPDHPSGTDRVAEVVRALEESYDIVVNIQGDEPLLTPTSLDRLVGGLRSAPAAQIATLAEPIVDVEELFDPNVVKVVQRLDGGALYFSRSPIPYHRGGGAALDIDFRGELGARDGGLAGYRKHQGIYAYRREALLELTRMRSSPLESDEGLEQLRALQAGFSIQVVESDFHAQSVDTPADLQRVLTYFTEAD